MAEPLSSETSAEKCANCRFSRHLMDKHGNDHNWTCRRLAPTDIQGGWPETRPSEWCGQWESQDQFDV